MTKPLAERAAQQYADFVAAYTTAPRYVAGEVSYVHTGQLELTVRPGCTPEALRHALNFISVLVEDLAK